jgi:hypothetical protein
MPFFEYKTVPAPRKGEKAKGVKGADGRLAQAMQSLLNAYGAEGWEYQRAETLQVEERSGIASKSVSYQSVLIFRREIEVEVQRPMAQVEEAQTEAEQTEAEQAAHDEAEQSGEDVASEVLATDQAAEDAVEIVEDAAPKKPAFSITSLRASRD